MLLIARQKHFITGPRTAEWVTVKASTQQEAQRHSCPSPQQIVLLVSFADVTRVQELALDLVGVKIVLAHFSESPFSLARNHSPLLP